MKCGDIVRLKSGGPDMTLRVCSPAGMCNVAWFIDKVFYETWTQRETLVVVPHNGHDFNNPDNAVVVNSTVPIPQTVEKIYAPGVGHSY